MGQKGWTSAVGSCYQRSGGGRADLEDIVCMIVICELCRIVIAYSLLAVTRFKSSINPITNANPVYNQSIMWH
jgi:hypothetical protein